MQVSALRLGLQAATASFSMSSRDLDEARQEKKSEGLFVIENVQAARPVPYMSIDQIWWWLLLLRICSMQPENRVGVGAEEN